MSHRKYDTNIYPNIFPALNIAKMQVVTDSAGPGRRFVIWLQGCLRNCAGCINTSFLPIKTVNIVHVVPLFTKIRELSLAGSFQKIEGITLTGGEPLLQAEALLPLLRQVKETGISVVCYTGYDYDLFKSEIQKKHESPGEAKNILCPENDSHKKIIQYHKCSLKILSEFFQHIDLLIDGEFRNDLPRGGIYCASANQKLRFLTGRYSAESIRNPSESTFTIDGEGIEFTGILSLDIAEKMKKRLRELGVVMGEDDCE